MPRQFLPFIIAPIVYFLIMNNSITPACQTDVATALEIVFGSVVFIGSLALGVFHHKNTAGEPQPKRFDFTKLLEKLKEFTFKKPTNQI